MDWFKFHHEVVTDSKVQTLPPETFRSWINLLCLASANEPRGILPPMKQVAFMLRVSIEEAVRIVDSLVSEGLIDITDAGGFTPHNWQARQGRSDLSTTRVRRFREKKKTTKKGSGEPSNLNSDGDETEVKRVSQRCETEVKRIGNASRLEERREEKIRKEAPNGAASPYPLHTKMGGAEIGGGAGWERFILDDEHRKTVEHARFLFGDQRAAEVAEQGSDIANSLEGRYDVYRNALDAQDEHRKAGKPPIQNPHGWCLKAGGRFLRDYPLTGKPPKSTPMVPTHDRRGKPILTTAERAEEDARLEAMLHAKTPKDFPYGRR